MEIFHPMASIRLAKDKDFMKIDKNHFFRQMTLRICSSLNIETALESCFLYLKDHIPLSTITFGLFDTESYALDIVATYGKKAVLPREKVLQGSKWIRERSVVYWQSMERVTLINRPDETKYYHELYKILGMESNSSILAMRLEMEADRIGTISFAADGTDRYTQDDAKLIRLLHDPFAIAMSNALKHRELSKIRTMLEDDNRFFRDQLWEGSGTNIIGADFGLREVMEKVRRVAPMDTPVLLQGETGVGKEVIAHAIHSTSPRKDGPLIKVNCGAISEHLIDSELFGHEKGAFTGAVTQKRGRFERAHHGTIFLDEVGELPPQAQVRLLHVLQSKLIERVGGTTSIKVDIRVLSATHRNLSEMVAADQFREDLWFRLNVFPIQIPPLRERNEDIPALVNHFLEKKKRELRIDTPLRLASGSMDNLINYDWPGNVRELINVVERGLIQHNRDIVSFEPRSIAKPDLRSPNVAALIPAGAANPFHKLDEINRIHIQKALKISKGKINGPGGAAEMLGVIPSTLRKRMDKLGIPFRRRSIGQ
jgi:transcriptional regulator with GAF, ATPase, and Fis domain